MKRGKLPIKLIAVDGHGGSGKSTLAKYLSDKLQAEIIHTDDFASWENPTAWQDEMIKLVFEPIINGERELNYPRSKWWEEHFPEPVTNQAVTEVMILEGISSLKTNLRPYIDYGIFVDTPLDICLERGIERDRGMDGKSEEEIKQSWLNWQTKELEYTKESSPKEFADLVVDGTKEMSVQVNDLLKALKLTDFYYIQPCDQT